MPDDVERGPKLGPFLFGGPERQDLVKLARGRRSRPTRSEAGAASSLPERRRVSGAGRGRKPRARRPESTWAGTGLGTRNVGRIARWK